MVGPGQYFPLVRPASEVVSHFGEWIGSIDAGRPFFACIHFADLHGRATPGELEEWASEQAADQWLRRIPEDPGGLLRRKFLFQYQRLGVDQDGNYVWPGDEEQPW